MVINVVTTLESSNKAFIMCSEKQVLVCILEGRSALKADRRNKQQQALDTIVPTPSTGWEV